MIQHDKLANIIKQSISGMLPKNISDQIVQRITDGLINAGAVLPPCKLGDAVWYISTENPFVAFEKELKPRKVCVPINGILITKDDTYISTENIKDVIDSCDKVNEDYVYLSEEEAEIAIGKQQNKI